MKNILLIKTCQIRPIILFIIWATIINTQAQIIYTDINPDFISDTISDFYNLDVNNDGIVDYRLESVDDPFWDYLMLSQDANSNNGCISVTPWYANPVPLNSGREIFNLVGYTNGETYEKWGFFTIGDCFGGDIGCFYDWKDKNANDKYLGLRFLINGQTHYGWARLNVTSPTEWVVKDYAYQATSNTSILAGQMPVLSLNDPSTSKNIKIATSNKIISVYNLNETTHYTLLSITGQRMLNGSITKENNIINTSLFSSGIYVIQLTSPLTGQTIQKKLAI